MRRLALGWRSSTRHRALAGYFCVTQVPPLPQSAVQSQLPRVGSQEHAEGRQAVGSQTEPLGQPPSQPCEGSGPSQIFCVSGTQAPPCPQSAVQIQLPLVGSQPQPDGRHALGSQIVPLGQPPSQPFEGSGPLHSGAPVSGTQAPPCPQSAVQIQSPVVGSQPQAEGRHTVGSHLLPLGQPLSQPSDGSGPVHFGAWFSETQLPSPQSALHCQSPVVGSQLQAEGWQAFGSHTIPLGQDWVGPHPSVEGSGS